MAWFMDCFHINRQLMERKRVVILGAGFAGLQLARRISRHGFDITLIDQYNFHQFQPLFYQVATGRLEPSSISFPLRKIFQRQEHVHVRIARVEHVDLNQKLVITHDCTFGYDYLVIATGCTTNFFGNKNIEQHAFTMKSTTESIALRNRILLNFEAALSCSDEDFPSLMNIVVAGGGPTGVELAGALIELKKNVLPKDYPDMDFSRLNIYLVEGQASTLANMSEVSQRKSREYLEKMGVQVLLNTLVEDYDGRTVRFRDGREIPTRTLIWTAGVMGNLPPGIPETMVVRGNRIRVDEYSRVDGYEDVFALGDIAYMEAPDWPKGHPQLANVAINQAKHLAANMRRMQTGATLKPFRYKNPGTMATIGKRKAVVDLPGVRFQGLFAWLVWMFLHLMLILSVKNKLIIFINWAISYFTNDTTLRLILLPTRKQMSMMKEMPESGAPPA
jgi:NADH dehydrogenase